MNNRVLITGYPRSGTTLLMTILHNAGVDTGYTNFHAWEIQDVNEGGLEFFKDSVSKNIRFYGTCRKGPPYPNVIKHPVGQSVKDKTIIEIAKNYNIKYSSVIICMREISNVIKSLQRRHPIKYKKGEEVKTGLEKSLAKVLYHITVADIPVILLEFPKSAEDKQYFLSKVSPLFPDVNLSYNWEESIKKERVHFK